VERVVILHGRPGRDEYFDPSQPSASNAHWLPWLQNELLREGFNAQTPEIPNAFEPHYETWRIEFERHLSDGPITFVGDSTGGGFLLRWLSENRTSKPRAVVLVAPWLDTMGELEAGNNFFDFDLDPELCSRTRVVIFNSTDDDESIQQSVEIIVKEVPGVEYREFENCGHFCLEDLGHPEFPELLEAVLPKKP
jgi:predicted alpha/beta hydrolase family esterase